MVNLSNDGMVNTPSSSGRYFITTSPELCITIMEHAAELNKKELLEYILQNSKEVFPNDHTMAEWQSLASSKMLISLVETDVNF